MSFGFVGSCGRLSGRKWAKEDESRCGRLRGGGSTVCALGDAGEGGGTGAEPNGAEVNGKSIPYVNLRANGRIAASPSAIMRYMNELHPRIGYLEPECRHRILKALALADNAHHGQKRKSGEPFIIHPVAVTVILADLRLDRDTLIAGLLHDTVEDTPVTLEELETLFGRDVRKIVEGETKFSKLASKVHKSVQTSTQPTIFQETEGNGVFGKDVHALTPLEVRALADEKGEEVVDKQAEYLRNMFLAMTEDVRVIIVKLADRLHNMRTLQFMKPAKQKKIATETLEFFAPLAHRLGMRRIKNELEDLSFKYMFPEDYESLKQEVEARYSRSNNELHLKEAQKRLTEILLDDELLKPRIKSLEVLRTTKPLYAIYQKIRRGETLETMLDLSTLVVVVSVETDEEDVTKIPALQKNTCYHILGRIHELWQPLPGRFKDYIAFPKPNGYQSLHTTVFQGPETRFLPLDIHIRTKGMHKIAEEGIAVDAFSSDPESSEVVSDSDWRERIMLWLRSIREYCHEFSDSSRDLVDAVRFDLLGNRVFVFTPKGRIVDLPRDSTPVDVAYRIHSEVGHRMIGSQVNGRRVGLDYKLQNADVVEIITESSAPGPSNDWLNFAKTRTARSKIRRLLRERERGSQVDSGRNVLNEAARTRLEPVPSDAGLTEIIPSLPSTVNGRPIKTVDDLYAALASNATLDNGMEIEPLVLDLLRDRRAKVIRDSSPAGWHADGILGNGTATETETKVKKQPSVVLASCCRPVRGDGIKAVKENQVEEVLSVHREHCTYLKKFEQEEGRRVDIDWDELEDIKLCAVQTVIEAKDCVGLLAAVSGVITSLGKPIVKSASSSYASGFATLAYEFLVEDTDELERVIEALQEMEGIHSIRRKGDPAEQADVDKEAKTLLDEDMWTEEL